MSSPAPATIPDRVTSKLPIACWDQYLQLLTERIAQEFPEWDHARRTNHALVYLQMMACGRAATASLSEFRKVLQKRGEAKAPAQKRQSKGRKLKAMLKRELQWKRIFNF